MDKIILFKEFGRYCITREENYKQRVVDCNKVSKFPPNCSKYEVLKSIIDWGIASEDEIIDMTGE